MKKLTVITCCSVFILLLSMPCNAQGRRGGLRNVHGYYASVRGGINFFSDSTLSAPAGEIGEMKMDAGYTFSGAAGYRIENTRIEGEISYYTADPDRLNSSTGTFDVSGEATALNFMLNAYYDFDTRSIVLPYVGAGIGISKVEMDGLRSPLWVGSTSDDDVVFAWQLMAGLNFQINEKLNADLFYRIFSTATPNFEDVEADVFSQLLGAGLTYNLY